jgi:hypothetical protein
MANTEKEQYLISDEVWARVVQIVQEAMLTGTDCVDLLRQIRVEPTSPPAPSGQLVLTEGYKKIVTEWHKQLLDDVERFQAQQRGLDNLKA